MLKCLQGRNDVAAAAAAAAVAAVAAAVAAAAAAAAAVCSTMCVTRPCIKFQANLRPTFAEN